MTFLARPALRSASCRRQRSDQFIRVEEAFDVVAADGERYFFAGAGALARHSAAFAGWPHSVYNSTNWSTAC